MKMMRYFFVYQMIVNSYRFVHWMEFNRFLQIDFKLLIALNVSINHQNFNPNLTNWINPKR